MYIDRRRPLLISPRLVTFAVVDSRSHALLAIRYIETRKRSRTRRSTPPCIVGYTRHAHPFTKSERKGWVALRNRLMRNSLHQSLRVSTRGGLEKITHGDHPRSFRLARIFRCLAVPQQPLKLFETLEIRVLKRLASGGNSLPGHQNHSPSMIYPSFLIRYIALIFL